jgi:hypothetical protein
LGRKHKHFWLSGLHPIGEIEPFVSRVCVSLTLIWVLLTQVSNKTPKGFDGLRSLVIINFQNYEGIKKKKKGGNHFYERQMCNNDYSSRLTAKRPSQKNS